MNRYLLSIVLFAIGSISASSALADPRKPYVPQKTLFETPLGRRCTAGQLRAVGIQVYRTTRKGRVGDVVFAANKPKGSGGLTYTSLPAFDRIAARALGVHNLFDTAYHPDPSTMFRLRMYVQRKVDEVREWAGLYSSGTDHIVARSTGHDVSSYTQRVRPDGMVKLGPGLKPGR